MSTSSALRRRLNGTVSTAADARCRKSSDAIPMRWTRPAARLHRWRTAGWPEAGMAGALGLALAGPRVYGGVMVDDATMGNGRREANAEDIRAALKLYRCADTILIVLVAALALVVIALR